MTLIAPFPKNTISSPFGMRNGRMHQGTDYAVPTGTPIKAVAAGTVESVGYGEAAGNFVIIRHANNVLSKYFHMVRMSPLSKNERVSEGQVVGYVGSTGRSTGPHLHLEIIINGKAVDPETVLTRGTQRKRNSMSTIYHKQNSKPALYALAGDSPGTEANWQELTANSIAAVNGWEASHGKAITLATGTWDRTKAEYLQPIKSDLEIDYDKLGASIAAAISDSITVKVDLPSGFTGTFNQ